MLQLTFYPDGTALSSPDQGILLCNTSRSLAELNVEFNHQRVTQIAQGFRAVTARLYDRGNQRNTLSIRIRRDVDFALTAFPDAEAAFIFALTQPARFTTHGTLEMYFKGPTTDKRLWMLNTGVTAITNKLEDLGVAPAFNYTFNGGLITETSPASL